MRRFFPLLLLPLLAGCDFKNSPLARDAARAVLTAKAYDRTTTALRRGDDQTMRASLDELARLDEKGDTTGAALRLSTAESLVAAAFNGEMAAGKSSPAAQREAARVAAENYRRALSFTPDFPSQSPRLLNALGYFLADRGLAQGDFQKAETFTRRALALMKNPKPDATRANVRDSLAWSLFKLGRFAEAEKEQVAAVAEARKSDGMSAELLLHLGEILIATKKNEQAKAALEESLKLEKNEVNAHERARELLAKI